jgi:hypothetical protein
MKPLLCVLIVAVGTPLASAQNLDLELAGQEMDHLGRVLAPVPEGAVWTITASKPARSRGKEALEAIAAALPVGAEVRRVHNRYSNGIGHVVVELANNERSELYLTANCILFHEPQFNRVRALPAENHESTDPTPVPGVFYELSWVSARYFVGTTIYNDRLCRVYQQFPPAPAALREFERRRQELSKLAPEDEYPILQTGPRPVPRSEAAPGAQPIRTAIIDVQTGLPVVHDEGHTLWSYTFSPESAAFSLPENYAEALAAFEKKTVNIEKKYRSPQ